MKNKLNFQVHNIFLILIVFGTVFLVFSQFLPGLWCESLTIIGHTCITIGVTLPVALYYQEKSNSEAFKILKSCNKAGIESIFESRKKDGEDFQNAVTKALNKSDTILLFGIAFRTILNQNSELNAAISEKINSPSVSLHVLLLDPYSNAALARAEVERGNATIDDIKSTLQNDLVSIAAERLKKIRKCDHMDGTQNNPEKWHERLNMEIRTYKTEPGLFLMIFGDTMFTEQYHRGRPDDLVIEGSCIGKFMPVIQYRRGSTGFKFLECHFKTIWKEAEDQTNTIITQAIKNSKN